MDGFEQSIDLIIAVVKELGEASSLVGTTGSNSGMSHTLSHSQLMDLGLKSLSLRSLSRK